MKLPQVPIGPGGGGGGRLGHAIIPKVLTGSTFGVNPNSLTTNLFIGYLLLFSISLLLFNFFILLFVQKIYVLYMINSIYFYSFCFAVINFMLIFLNIMISLKRLNKSR